MDIRAGALALSALLAASCGTTPTPTDPSLGNDVVFLRTGTGILAVAASSGEERLAVPGGVASPGGRVLASTDRREGVTIVRRVTPSGRELTRALVPGELQARLLSSSGDLVALTDGDDYGSKPYAPVGRQRTRIVVVDASGSHREFALEGNYEPEAFSVNDRELFVIEHFPAAAPKHYRVRRLILDNGRVVPVGRFKSLAPDVMNGTGRTHVYAPRGHELYTLYTQQDEAGHQAWEHSSAAHAFIHVLNLEDSWAHCIDLPHAFASGHVTASAMAVSSQGTRLYVADWTNGAVAVVNPKRVRVIETAAVDFGVPDGETFAAASEEWLYMGGHDEVVVVDLASLTIDARWQMEGEVSGLSLTADERRLYVSVGGNEIVALDASTGRALNEVTEVATEGIEFIDS